MKNLFKVLQFTFIIGSLTVLAACGDDEKPANRVSVDGKGYKFSKSYVVTQAASIAEEDGYSHTVYLTGDGLSIDTEEVEFDGEGNVVIMYLLSEDEELPAGTYNLVAQEDAEFGDAATFALVSGYSGSSNFDDAFRATSGKIKVSKSGSKYTFKMDFDEYLIGTTEEGEEGEGSIKGYFNGKLEVVDISGADTRLSKNAHPLMF